MGAIVGVHGIANQQLGRHQLESTWLPALRDGIERASGQLVHGSPEFRIAFYGDLFLSASNAEKGEILDNLRPDEEAFLGEAVSELGDYLSATPGTAKMRPPSAILNAIARLDALVGSRASAVLGFGDVVQVRRYLLDPALKSEAEGRVDAVVDKGVAVLIGYSLGSVVALEYLRGHPDRHVDLLLTLGSPLAFQCVRSLMQDTSFASTRLPSNIGRWVNVYDPQDIVACAGPLNRLWKVVEDVPVNNGSEPHDVTRYLDRIETGRCVLGAVSGITA